MVLDKKPDEPRDTIELKASRELKKQPPPTESFDDRAQGAMEHAAEEEAAAGAAAGAGVLTAVDEDEEGEEEAPVPHEFDYETEGEDVE